MNLFDISHILLSVMIVYCNTAFPYIVRGVSAMREYQTGVPGGSIRREYQAGVSGGSIRREYQTGAPGGSYIV